jgi:hypothetical protein
MAGLAIEVKGFEELKRKIILLGSDKDKKREMLLILRQIAKPTLSTAKVLAPISKKIHKARGVTISPGNLKKSLGFITGKNNNPTVYVGARAKGPNKGWYANFVHDGINIYNKGFKRKHTKGVNAAGVKSRTVGNPFLANAYDSTKGIVTADAERRMANFMQRRIDKLK